MTVHRRPQFFCASLFALPLSALAT